MNRDSILEAIKDGNSEWDVIIIGGGASGLGAAVDAASRGCRTLLLEMGDFAQGTSSRSTKLIHGGVRYLRQGRLSLVRKALHERALLLKNAPHLVHTLPFLLPCRSQFASYYYFLGMKLYDLLAGRFSLGRSTLVSKNELRQRMPMLDARTFSAAICYYDAQFDDARLAISLLQTFVELGGIALNYMPVEGIGKTNDILNKVKVRDAETQTTYELHGNVIVNATGAYVDTIRRMDDATSQPMIVPSQGSHIVLDRSFFPSNSALIIPDTGDGRVLFIIPWHDRVLVGTTDSPLRELPTEPTPTKEEILYLLEYAGKVMSKKPTENDILGVFAGIRPLVQVRNGWKNSADLSRDYSITVSDSHLVTVAGGKWTTYRKMGADTIDVAAKTAKLPISPSRTESLPIHGWMESLPNSPWQYYGSDIAKVEALAANNPSLLEKLHTSLPCRAVDVIWAIRNEMARTVEDILSRRTRCLLLNARVSCEIAPQVAALMAAELHYDKKWEEKQVDAFLKLAQRTFYF